MRELKVALVGCGAIGSMVLRHLRETPQLRVVQVVTTQRSLERTQALVAELHPQASVSTRLEEVPRPDILVECAGHAAVEQHVLPALQAGVPCLLVSVGALATPGRLERLQEAATLAGTRLRLLSGAIGGMDALAAARLGGLHHVRYTGRKPPQAWAGSPAEAHFDLTALDRPTLIFEGTAREAARDFPKNANVAAAVALAGMGLDQTLVRLVADPWVAGNQHEIEAEGAFGRLELKLVGEPLPENLKTSALTVYSVLRGIAAEAAPLVI